MNNVIADLPSLVSAAAMQAGTNPALKTGSINHAASIYGAFVVDADKQGLSTLETIKEIATTHGLSCVEFAAQCKASQTIADTVDKTNGFIPLSEAKGIEKYGPKRRLLNQRLSEAKQLFGVFKLAPALLAEKGYWPSLAIAREFLAEKGIKWDNTTIESDDVKNAKKEASLERSVLAATLADVPMNADETRAEYLIRVDALAEQAIEAEKAKVFNKGVTALNEKLVKQHGNDVIDALLMLRVGALDDEGLESLQQWIQEEMAVRILSPKAEAAPF